MAFPYQENKVEYQWLRYTIDDLERIIKENPLTKDCLLDILNKHVDEIGYGAISGVYEARKNTNFKIYFLFL